MTGDSGPRINTDSTSGDSGDPGKEQDERGDVEVEIREAVEKGGRSN